ncbi:unnamed protein product [Cylindrotheca closterium]|uniref:RING-type domain-containing protein n=1 Tax=Cylindrotheca closterium TaxID=2856 RepID=A0AAD2G056_9STRA|nr:unnamed protein product [Cylindrotheca closterium]
MVDFEGMFQGSLFFVSGVVVIIAIVGLVYFISWLFDRTSGEDLLTPDELEARRVAPILVRQAGLAGLLKDEQTKVIRYHFEANSFPFVKETNVTKASKDESLKKTTEASSSNDENLEKTEESSVVVDKEAVNVDGGETDDPASDDAEKEEQADDEAETSKIDEVEESKDGDIEEGKAESTITTSIVKSEESSEDDSPEITETKTDKDEKDDLESKADTKEDIVDSDENSDEENKDEPNQGPESKEASAAISDDLEEAEEGICSICLEDYEHGEKVVIGSSCGHMFHLACFMEWVEKKHLNCPICRSDMITPDEFTASSYQVLGEARVDKIRGINEEAARRLEAWSIKNQEEIQQRQQAAAAAAEPEASTEEQAATTETETDVETGKVGAEAEGEAKPEIETEIEGGKTIPENNNIVTTSSDVSA